LAAKDTRGDVASRLPVHVAIIMDGNGRWALNRGWPRLVGHRRGAERVRQIVQACPELGVKHLTVYAFSTENWKRSTEEVIGLMRLFRRYIEREADELSARGVRVRFIGDRTPLEAHLCRLMDGIEARTRDNDLLHLTIAINYGGRNEIARAARAMAASATRGDISVDEVDEVMVGRFLDTADLPDPDLVIRTSGETRISNYLLWQSAYAEYEFTPTLWPDFTAREFADILLRYSVRERRFGAVSA
jgi:undecaprenyl diphosphate synthase